MKKRQHVSLTEKLKSQFILWQYLSPKDWWAIALASSMTLISVILSVVSGDLWKEFIDKLVQHTLTAFLYAAMLYIACNAGSRLLLFYAQGKVEIVFTTAANAMSIAAVEQQEHLKIDVIGQTRREGVPTTDADGAKESTLQFWQIAQAICQIVGVVYFAISIVRSMGGAIIILPLLLLLFIAAPLLGPRGRALDKIRDITSNFGRTLRRLAAPSGRRFTRFNYIKRLIAKLSGESREQLRLLKLTLINEGTVGISLYLLQQVTLVTLFAIFPTPGLTSGTIAALGEQAQKGQEALDKIFESLLQLQQLYVHGRRIRELMKATQTPLRSSAAPNSTPSQVTLTLEKVSIGTTDESGSYVPLVSNIDCDIKPGVTVVFGDPQNGKNKFLHVLAGEKEATGTVQVNGELVAAYERKALIGFSGAAFEPDFQGTIRDLLFSGNPEATEAHMWRALQAVGLDDYVKTLKDRKKVALDFPLVKAKSLDGPGAVQLELARLALQDAPLVLLAEPLIHAAQPRKYLMSLIEAMASYGRNVVLTCSVGTRVPDHWHVIFWEMNHADLGVEVGQFGKLVKDTGRFAAWYRLQQEAMALDTKFELPPTPQQLPESALKNLPWR